MTDRLRTWLRDDRARPLGFGVVYLLLAWATLPGYGLVWDAWEFYLGDQTVAYYGSLDSRYLDYAVPYVNEAGRDLHDLAVYDEPGHPDQWEIAKKMHGNPVLIWPHQVWPVGATVASLVKSILYGWFGMDVYDAYHAVVPLYAVLLGWLLYLWGRERLGRTEAWLAMVLLACHPRWWAHLHNNFKDVPAVLLYAVAALAFYEGLVRKRWGWLVISSVAWGVGMATKGNALLLPLVLIPWYGWALLERRRQGEALVEKHEWWALGTYPVIGLAVMVALWPYLLMAFPEHLMAYVESLFERGLAKPEAVAAGWQGWIPPVNAVVTMPLVMLIPAVAGLVMTLRKWWVARWPDGIGLLMVLWVVVPIGRVMLPGARDFDVIRHWIEVLVPIAYFAGIGGAAGLRTLNHRLAESRWWAERRVLWQVVVVALLLTPTVWWMVANHPQNLPYYNQLVGGLDGARAKGLPEATDYWGSSYREGYQWLNANAGENSLVLTGAAEHLTLLAQDVWMRPDLKVLRLNQLDEATYMKGIEVYPGEIYMVYIVHPMWYYQAVWSADANLQPVHEIRVDGAPVLRILRLK